MIKDAPMNRQTDTHSDKHAGDDVRILTFEKKKQNSKFKESSYCIINCILTITLWSHNARIQYSGNLISVLTRLQVPFPSVRWWWNENTDRQHIHQWHTTHPGNLKIQWQNMDDGCIGRKTHTRHISSRPKATSFVRYHSTLQQFFSGIFFYLCMLLHCVLHYERSVHRTNNNTQHTTNTLPLENTRKE